MTRFPLMERSAPLFPDILDAWENKMYETHVFSGPSTYRTDPLGRSDHRALVVLWNDPKWDCPEEPRQRWTVEIIHYIHAWSGEGRKRQHHFHTRSVRRHFEDRGSTVEFVSKLAAIFERINDAKEAEVAA
jgi:hypothetical protein